MTRKQVDKETRAWAARRPGSASIAIQPQPERCVYRQRQHDEQRCLDVAGEGREGEEEAGKCRTSQGT